MSNNVRGVAPGFMLASAQNYNWELKDRVEIRLPLRGSIADYLGSGAVDSEGLPGGEDAFSIFEDDVFQMWEVVRVLFALGKYPQLQTDECLNVVAMELAGEELVLYGQIIRSLECQPS